MGSSAQQQGSGGSTGGRRMGVVQPEVDEGAEEAAEASDELDMDLPRNAPARRGVAGHRPGGGATAQGRRCRWGGIRMRSMRVGAAAPIAMTAVARVVLRAAAEAAISAAEIAETTRSRVPCPRSQSASCVTVGQPVRSDRFRASPCLAVSRRGALQLFLKNPEIIIPAHAGIQGSCDRNRFFRVAARRCGRSLRGRRLTGSRDCPSTPIASFGARRSRDVLVDALRLSTLQARETPCVDRSRNLVRAQLLGS